MVYKENPDIFTGRGNETGFSLIELLLVLSLITILVAMMLPALRGARERARDVACMSNLRQVSLGMTMYADERGRLPQRFNWADPDHNWGYDDDLLRGGMAVPNVFVCPRHVGSSYDRPTFSEPSYGMNWFYDNTPLAAVERTDTILVADTYGPAGAGSHRADRDEIFGRGLGALDTDRHGTGPRGGAGYAFFDTHVEMTDYFRAAGQDQERWGRDMGDHDRHIWPVP